jgi:hypothetical protein
LDDVQRSADIETLARMAARLAGRDPDEYLKMVLGDVTAFDDYIWRYPDFLNRAEAAYALLNGSHAPDLSGHGQNSSAVSQRLAGTGVGPRKRGDGSDPSMGGSRASSR